MDDAFVRQVQLLGPEQDEQRTGHPWDLSPIASLAHGLALDRKVTYLIGENGSGKSTLLEATAGAASLNPEDGSSNFSFSTRDSHSELWRSIRLVRGVRRPRTDFLLAGREPVHHCHLPGGAAARSAWGLRRTLAARAVTRRIVLAVLVNRFGPDGFYLLDEPEAALSTQNCLTCLRRVHELVTEGSLRISRRRPRFLQQLFSD